jgi:hypothetical protein
VAVKWEETDTKVLKMAGYGMARVEVVEEFS